jgi:membrane associated rhomboid family serine protease
MFLIYGTDAPLYHYPIVTIGMVVVNVVIHWLIVVTGFDATPYYLYFGDGFHPLQWVTHNFLHGGIAQGWPHLFFNMIFLWPFGMIVEGKIGWARMLALYMAIAMFQGFTQQLVMLPSDPGDDAAELVELLDHPNNEMTEEEKDELRAQFRQDLLRYGSCSLGSSAVIFGLMAVCAIWAPENEFESYFRWSALIRAPDGGIRDWTVLTVCGMFVAKEVGLFVIQNGALSSAALHLNGCVVGGAFGLAMLYFGYVDCEGFDLISYVTGEKFKSERMIRIEERERLETVEAARPTGPPTAVVPKMAHEVAKELQQQFAIPSVLEPPPPAKAVVQTQPIEPLVPQAAIGENDQGIAADPTLPVFDDTTTELDPITKSRNQIESAIAKGTYASAVKRLAGERKQHPGFVLSAASMGKLAEGLIRERHIKPALTVLAIGAEAYPAFAPRWRVRAASVELSINQDPIAAIKVLKSVDKDMLDRTTRAHYLKVAERATRLAQQ